MVLSEIRKIMYTPVNPSFTIQKWGLRGSKLYRPVFVMNSTYLYNVIAENKLLCVSAKLCFANLNPESLSRPYLEERL